MSQPRLVIVGASYAGQELAGAARSAGFAGSITLLGHESEPPYQRPPLSKGFLLGTTQASRLPLVSPTYFSDRNIQCHLNTTVQALDIQQQSVLTTAGDRFDYDWLALCTGARARPLQVPGADHPKVFTLRSLADAQNIRQLMVSTQGPIAVIGGGFIGLEVTAALASAGLKVAVFESADRLLARAVPERISQSILARHEAAGVEVYCQHTLHRLSSQHDETLIVHTNSGDFPCAAVIVGIGALPNIELAQQAGIICDRGIVTDTYGQTSVPHVLAAGDCAEFPVPYAPDDRTRIPESIQATKDLARAAASVVAGQPKPITSVPWFWSDQYDLKLQMTGIMAANDTWVWRGDPAYTKGTLFGLRGHQLGCAFSLNSPAEHMMTRQLLAASTPLTEAELMDSTLPLKDFLTR